MDGKHVVELANPPAYIVSGSVPNSEMKHSTKGKALFGYAVAITTALVVVLILGGVYYYRSLEMLQDTIRIYSDVDKTGKDPVDRQLEVDTSKNTLVYHLSGNGIEPGTLVVMDYTKSLTGIYDPKSRKCYLIAGIRSDIADPKTVGNMLEKNMTAASKNEELKYRVADSYPASDKSILPAALKEDCTYLPVYWLERTIENGKSVQKRDCHWLCYPIGNGLYYCVLQYCD